MAGDAPSVEPQRPRRRWRRLARRALRVALAGAILLLAMLHLLPYVTDTAFVKRRVARIVEGRLDGAQVRLKTLRVAPVRRRAFLLEDLRIAPADAPGAPVVAVGRVECWWRPSSLLSREVRLTSASVRSVRVDLRRERGQWNLRPRPAPPRPPAPPFRLEELRLPLSLRVERASVRDVDVTLAIDDTVKLAVTGLRAESSCTMSRTLTGAAQGHVAAGGLQVDLPRARVHVGRGLEARAELTSDGRRANVECAGALGDVATALGAAGTLAPLSLLAGLTVEADLTRLEVPNAQFDVQCPGLMDATGTVSLTRGDGWDLRGGVVAGTDVGALADVFVPSRLALPAGGEVDARLLATADVSGHLRSLAPLDLALRLRTRASGADWRGLAGLALGAISAEAELNGCDVRVAEDLEVTVARGLSGLSLTDVTWSAGSVGVDVADLGGVTAKDLRGRLTAEACLPTVAAARVWADTEEEVTVRTRWTEGVTVPARARATLRAADLLSPTVARIELDGLSGAVGELVPGFSLSASATGYGRSALAARGRAVLDLGQACGLLRLLPERMRALVGDVGASGGAAAVLEAGGRLGNRLFLSGQTWSDVSEFRLARGAMDAAFGEAQHFQSFSVAAGTGFLPRSLRTALCARLTRLRGAVAAGDGSPEPASSSVALDSADLRADVVAPELVAAAAHVTVAGSVKGLVAEASKPGSGTPFRVPAVSLATEARAALNPLAGDVSVERLTLTATPPASLAVEKLVARGFGADALEALASASLPDLGAVMSWAAVMVPERLARYVPTLTGRAEATARLSGRLPMPEAIVGALEMGRQVPVPEVFPLDAFAQRELPLSLDATFAVKDASLVCTLRPGLSVGLPQADLSGRLALSEGNVQGSVTAGVPIFRFGLLPIPLDRLDASAAFDLRRFSELRVNGAHLSALGGAFEADGSLRADGLARLTGVPGPAQLLEKLDLDVRSNGSLQLGIVPPVFGLTVSGSAGWDFALGLTAGQRLDVAVRPRLEGFTARFRDLVAVDGAGGGLMLSKAWRILPPDAPQVPLSEVVVAEGPVPPAPDPRAQLPDFVSAADGLAPPAERLTVRSVSILGREVVRDLSAEVAVRGAAVSVPALYLHLLGGRLVGKAELGRAAGGRELRVDGEFADVDLRRMLPARLRDFPGDSQVNGTFGMRALLAPPPAGSPSYNPFQDVSARCEVTRIGPSALDRAMLALDPEGANPQIVLARRALLLGSPRRARAVLERGFLSMDVEMQGLARGLAPQYSIPRFNIARLFEAPLVSGIMGRAAPAFTALDLLDADTLELTPDGGVRLR